MTSGVNARFELTPGGKFAERRGALAPGAAFSQRKVCFAATDVGFLADFLYELSLRPDCHYVKYSVIPRDGMHLGRCFLQTDRAAGELCQQLKQHPKLLVTVQDDDFFAPFREP
jgi:hypothetical protein